eukprot:scaffold84048_cov20-Prasinocladus_malaysianus.AAC.1
MNGRWGKPCYYSTVFGVLGLELELQVLDVHGDWRAVARQRDALVVDVVSLLTQEVKYLPYIIVCRQTGPDESLLGKTAREFVPMPWFGRYNR